MDLYQIKKIRTLENCHGSSMSMLKQSIIYIFLLTTPVISFAQLTIAVTDVINMIEQGSRNENASVEILDYLENQKRNISAIEKMEFRTETNRWDIGRQNYTFRTSLNSKAERVGEKKEIESSKQLINKEAEKRATEKRYTIYRDLLEIYFLQREIELLAKELIVVKDELTILNLKAQNGSAINPSSYVKAEVELSDLILKKQRLEREIQVHKNSMFPKPESDFIIDFEAWASIDKVQKRVEEKLNQEIKVSVDDEIQLIKQLQAKIDLNNEVAERERVIDFVQMQYSGNSDKISGEQISLGVGLMLPSRHVNRRNIREM